eukprot:jgi/Mesen1/7318/ME000376S06495
MAFYVGLALPMASLLAPLLGLGRLGADNELGALHAIGVTARRLACLAAVLFMCVTTTHLLLAETVTPVCQRKAAAVVAQANQLYSRQGGGGGQWCRLWCTLSTSEVMEGGSRRGGRRRRRKALRRLFHARSFDGTTMHNVTLVELLQQQQQHEEVVVEEEGSGHAPPPWGPQGLCAAAAAAAEGPALENVATDHTAAAAAAAGAAGLEGGEATSGKVERMVVAQAALWDAARLAWVMHHGTEYVLQHAPPVAAASSAREGPAERDTPPGDIPAHVALAGGGMWATPGSGWTSLRTVQSFTHRAFPGLPRVPLDLAESDGGRSLDDMTLAEVARLQQLLALSNNIKGSRKIGVKMHQRLALPFACTIFGIAGTLISLRLPRNQKQIGFAITLAIVFVYYALSIAGVLMAQLGLVGPIVGAWIPNLVGLVSVSGLLLGST